MGVNDDLRDIKEVTKDQLVKAALEYISMLDNDPFGSRSVLRRLHALRDAVYKYEDA